MAFGGKSENFLSIWSSKIPAVGEKITESISEKYVIIDILIAYILFELFYSFHTHHKVS